MIIGSDYIGIGIGAIIIKNHQILLIRRSSKLHLSRTSLGMWSVPGGEVDFGETLEHAVIREAQEEIDVDIKVHKLIGYTDQILHSPDLHWLSIHFLCTITSGRPSIQEPDKCDQIKYFSVSNPPPNSGIAHVISPLYQLGHLTKQQFHDRQENTPAS